MKKTLTCLFISLLFVNGIIAQQSAPAYPLITHDPYFSVWSKSDTLSAVTTSHWTGSDQSMIGLIQVDGDFYRFMGNEEKRYDIIAAAADEKNYQVRFTQSAPAAGWELGSFNDKGWKSGVAPFGDGIEAKTKWLSHDLWTRRTFNSPATPAGTMYLKIKHDDNVEVFLNGVRVYETTGWLNKYAYYKISEEVKRTLKPTGNVLAIHVVNTAGGQWLDAGLVADPPVRGNAGLREAVQKSVRVTTTQTNYQFSCGAVDLELNFLSPLLMHNLDLLSRPVSYLSYKVKTADNKPHNVKVFTGISSALATNTASQPVISERGRQGSLQWVRTGTTEQPVLKKKGDDLRIDWGYLYVASPLTQHAEQYVSPADGLIESFVNARRPAVATPSTRIFLNTVLDFKMAGSTPAEQVLMIGYDDLYSIQYFGKNLKPWWKTGNKTIITELQKAAEQYDSLRAVCTRFDQDLHQQSVSAGGEEYASLNDLAYRQSISAHKLVRAPDGEILFLSKENYSNGCINTVDVTYPSAPLFLLYNPDLLKGMLNGIFYYSESGKYKEPYPAHDLGTYPLANGLVYDIPMPVEEAGNMIILTAAITRTEKDAAYARRHWTVLTKWADFLVKEGFDPANQLCTDDFAGHLARNANLSVKAIMGIASYASMATQLGHQAIGNRYMDTAKAMALRWMKIADAGDHYALTFNDANTWSQKYNMVWDKVLGFSLFPQAVYDKEINYYLSRQLKYGLPLDNRKTYTKSDWIIWSASLAKDNKTFMKFMDPLGKYIRETKTRVPMCDWFETTNGEQVGFQARSVVGGYFMKVLMDQWSGNGTQTSLVLGSALQSHMVVQQNQPFRVWGNATPGAAVTVRADWTAQVTTTAAADGSFMAILPVPVAKENDFRPHTITVESGNEKSILDDLLIGDLWFCSGQSNMQFSLKEDRNAATEVPSANYPQIRLLKSDLNFSAVPVEQFRGKWELCTPATAADFSAVGYSFGKELFNKLKIPVGLVFSGIGASAAQAFVPQEVLAGDTMLNRVYLQPYLNSEKSKEKIDGGFSFEKVTRPFLLYNAMIHPFRNLSVKGFCWYQGESNRSERVSYTRLTQTMIESWRKVFAQGNLPFYYVQVAPFFWDQADSTLADYAYFREAQENISHLNNTGMAVSSDVGEAKDLHPKNKVPIGKRLAALALSRTYGMLDVVSTGPQFSYTEIKGSRIIIHFKKEGSEGLRTSDGQQPLYFTVAGTDRRFYPAEARIEGNTVVVTSSKVKKPVEVRYAFTNSAITNLENRHGFPAVQFRSDDFPE